MFLMKRVVSFSYCGECYIARLKEEGRYSTAHVYRNALRSFASFCGTASVRFRQITRECLRRYSQYLYGRGLKPNTVSTYMRMLRSVYNRGVESRDAPYVPHLFREVYTGVDVRQKKALPTAELHRLLYADPGSETLRHTQSVAALLFQLCGMPFVDLAYMENSDLKRDVLRYNRVKTRVPISLEVLDTALALIERIRGGRPSTSGAASGYLLPILSGGYKRGCESSFREYQSALRTFNNRLKSLAKALRLKSPVTSYTLRHSWATTAKRRGVSVEMISELLGHKSIRTTQIYLKSFDLSERTKVNRLNCSYVMNYKSIV